MSEIWRKGKGHHNKKRRGHHNKRGGMEKTREVSEVDRPVTCMLSGDRTATSMVKNVPLQMQDKKWHLDTPELKERISHKTQQQNHDNVRYIDKLIRPKSSVCSHQPCDCSDCMYPPLGSHPRKSNVHANQPTTQHKAMTVREKEDHKDLVIKATQQIQKKRSCRVSTQESKPECRTSNIFRVKREKEFLTQADVRKEMIFSVQESIETKVTLESTDTRSKELKEYDEIYNISELMKGLSLNSSLNIYEEESRKNSTNDQGSKFRPSSSKPKNVCFSFPEKLLLKREISKKTCITLKNDIKPQVDEGSHNIHDKADISQQPHAVSKSNIKKQDDASHGVQVSLTQTSDNSTPQASFSSFKSKIIAYLRMILKGQDLQTPSDDTAEVKSVSPYECSATDESQSKVVTRDAGKTSQAEVKMTREEFLICEEMFKCYVVISNLPFGVSKEEVLYHISKIGPISYLIMEKYRAHVIFFEAEDAETAFRIRHVLFGKELVVYHPRRPSCTLHLSGLTNNTPDEEVIKVVSQFGVVLGYHRPARRVLGVPVGYCFIRVEKQMAEDILKQGNLVVNNVRIFVEVSSQSEVKFVPQTPSSQQPSFLVSHLDVQRNNDEYKLQFRNVSHEASYDVIKEYFQEYGKLRKVFVRNGQGFVVFASRESLEQALSCKHIILGSELRLYRG